MNSASAAAAEATKRRKYGALVCPLGFDALGAFGPSALLFCRRLARGVATSFGIPFSWAVTLVRNMVSGVVGVAVARAAAELQLCEIWATQRHDNTTQQHNVAVAPATLQQEGVAANSQQCVQQQRPDSIPEVLNCRSARERRRGDTTNQRGSTQTAEHQNDTRTDTRQLEQQQRSNVVLNASLQRCGWEAGPRLSHLVARCVFRQGATTNCWQRFSHRALWSSSGDTTSVVRKWVLDLLCNRRAWQ